MTNQEILDMCRRLASKYRNRQEYDDLVSTGVVSCLEMRAEGVDEPSKLYHEARKEMGDYINMRMSPVSYSKGRFGREAAKGDATHYVSLNDDENTAEVESAEDIFGSYELKNILQVLGKVLTTEEREIMVALWNNNNNLTEAGESLGKSKQSMRQYLTRINTKLVTISDVY